MMCDCLMWSVVRVAFRKFVLVVDKLPLLFGCKNREFPVIVGSFLKSDFDICTDFFLASFR